MNDANERRRARQILLRSWDPPPEREGVGPRELEAMGDAERETLARQLELVEPATSLWVTVLGLALSDFAYLLDRVGQRGLNRYEAKRVQEIREHDPVRFFDSGWFEQICEYLGLDPDVVRPSADDLRRAAGAYAA